MTACLSHPGIYTLHNVPNLRDTRTMVKLLEIIGCKIETNEPTANFFLMIFNKSKINSEETFEKLVKKVSQITDNLYGLVNNAAYNPKIESQTSFGDFESLSLSEWDNELELNLSSPVFLVKAFLPIFNREINEYCKIVLKNFLLKSISINLFCARITNKYSYIITLLISS